MPKKVQKFFVDYIEYYKSEKYDRMAELFTYPAVILENTRPRVLHHKDEMIAALAEIRKRRMASGATQMRSELIIQDKTPKARTSVQIIWSYLDEHGNELRHCEVRYFVQNDADGLLRIEMIESIIMQTELTPVAALPFRKH